ncbi:MAG: hypothetical protein ACE5F1_12105, partial [Planctomycetota bacterium]
MQTAAAPPTLNPFVGIGPSLALRDRETGVGGTLSYGDRFSGLELGFFREEIKQFKTPGQMEENFGHLNRGDRVTSESLLNLLRINYVYPLIENRTLAEATLRLGAGLGIHHTEFKLDAKEINGARRQTLAFKDDLGVPMLLLRAEADYKPFRARIDFGWNRGDYGGLNGTFLDVGLSLHYRVQKGVSGFVGYWRYDLPGEDAKDDLLFEFDMRLAGWIAGVRFDL